MGLLDLGIKFSKKVLAKLETEKELADMKREIVEKKLKEFGLAVEPKKKIKTRIKITRQPIDDVETPNVNKEGVI